MKKQMWMAGVVCLLILSGMAGAEWKFDLETPASTPASGYTHVDEFTYYDSATGYGFTDSVYTIESRDRSGSSNPLLRDGIYLLATADLRVDVPNGGYTVNVVGGDYLYATYQAFRVSGDGGATWTYLGRDGSTDDLDGITWGKPRPYTYKFSGLEATWPRVGDSDRDLFNVPAKQYMQGKDVPVTVSAGYILVGARSETRASFVNFVEIKEGLAPTPPPTWKYDFEPVGMAPAWGYTHVDETTAYSASTGYGFIDMTGYPDYFYSRDRGTTLQSDVRLKDFVALTTANQFRADLANGAYAVNVVVGDPQYATYQAVRLSGDGGATWTYIGRDGSTDDIDGVTWGKARPHTYRFDGLEATWPRVGDSWPDVFIVTANQYMQGKYVPVTVSVGYLLIGSRFDNPSGASTLNFVEITPESAIMGTVTLSDYPAGLIGDLGLRVDLRQGGSVVRTEQLFPDAAGTFVVHNVAAGTYDMLVKAGASLQAVVSPVTVGGAAAIVPVSLVNGDLDGDNQITSTDLSVLLAGME